LQQDQPLNAGGGSGVCLVVPGHGGAHGVHHLWRGDDLGGRYSFQQADWGNCAFRYGCFNQIDPYIHIWINGNGTWTQKQGD
jgi:hypothetical protein